MIWCPKSSDVPGFDWTGLETAILRLLRDAFGDRGVGLAGRRSADWSASPLYCLKLISGCLRWLAWAGSALEGMSVRARTAFIGRPYS